MWDVLNGIGLSGKARSKEKRVWSEINTMINWFASERNTRRKRSIRK